VSHFRQMTTSAPCPAPDARASLRGGREMATGERSKHLPLVEQADGGGGSSNGDSAVAQASRGGRTQLRSVATSVACSGALNPATGAGSRPQTVALSVGRSPTEKERSSDRSVNRDALLQALFPAGIPAKESVIRSVNSWLDEAERLARMR
jgi:hypothetical protein